VFNTNVLNTVVGLTYYRQVPTDIDQYWDYSGTVRGRLCGLLAHRGDTLHQWGEIWHGGIHFGRVFHVRFQPKLMLGAGVWCNMGPL